MCSGWLRNYSYSVIMNLKLLLEFYYKDLPVDEKCKSQNFTAIVFPSKKNFSPCP